MTIKGIKIVEKKLYYGSGIQNQIMELSHLLEDGHFQMVRTRMKSSGFRCGFTCLFYGGPGSGKTETVLQLARQTGRDIVQVNISQIKREMENLDGIMIATTNLAQNMDKAFERRFLYKIKFEKPTLEARMHIWHEMIPTLSDSDTKTLAERYDFSGGQIENIARHYTISNILYGDKTNNIESLMTYCDNERLETKQTRKIGF